ncbi:MAG: arginine--tRNA ligase, partial [Chthoniobacterales bacterium]
MPTFQASLAKELSRALAAAGLPALGDVVPATDARFGDYQTNAALVLAKQRGENPKILAQTIIEHLEVAQWCEPPTIAGAGFINLSLKPDAVAAKTMELLQDERLCVPLADPPHRVV